MRTEFTGGRGDGGLLGELRAALPPDAEIRIAPAEDRRIVVLATKEPHCVGELLLRNAFGEPGARVLAVISNHAQLQPLVERFGIPYHHVGHEGLSRDEHEERVADIAAAYEPDYLVLAKYMRVPGPGFLARAVELVCEERVFLVGNRTVVFE